MSDDFRKYEIACEQIRRQNAELLSDFRDWLNGKSLSETTVQKHVDNIDFYVNEYLLYEDAIAAADGCMDAGMFLGDWYIRKAAWTSEASIRGSAASLKKFYTFMQEKGLVQEEDVQELHKMIKVEMPEWLATLRRYDDPSIEDSEEIWGR